MNTILLALLSVVGLLAMSCAQAPERDASGNGASGLPNERSASAEQGQPMEFGERIAGTWLGTYAIDAPEAVRTGFISTYHPDGTAVTTSERMFGAGRSDRHGLTSTNHVQWEATGPREIRWRVLHFGYDSEGSLTYISRTHGTREFDDDFESCRGAFQVEVFAPDALLDPLDPNNPVAEPIATAEGTDEARRLHVQIPSP
jgi:hypothetical protein